MQCSAGVSWTVICVLILTQTMADKISAAEVGKMKVADLKKLLKEKGLPLTGSKSELLDRLTEALETDEDVLIDNEESSMFEDRLLYSHYTPADTSTTSEDALLDDNVDLSLTEPAAASPSKPKPKPQTKAEPVTKTAKPSTSPETSDTEKKTKVISTSLSSTEKLKSRAERFGVVSEDIKKQLRAERFGTTASTGAAKLSTTGTTADVDALKKRAERFGTVTSSTLAKVDEAEKVRKRKERFGDLMSVTNNKPKVMKLNTSSEEDAKMKKRAERFGIS